MQLYLDSNLKKYFHATSSKELFDEVMALQGERFRAQKGRFTEKITLGDQTYFIKKHTGVGIREIFKNIFQCRLPVISAKQEWRALSKLRELNIDVPRVVGFGECGINPARKQSFLLMEDMVNTISLEQWVSGLTSSPIVSDKRKIIADVARIARIMHQHGINHRDFYICHFLLGKQGKGGFKLTLIDLHRAQIHRHLRARLQIKDLAGLYFSSKNSGLTTRDRLRFMRYYGDLPLRQLLADQKDFWLKVKYRGEKLFNKESLMENN